MGFMIKNKLRSLILVTMLLGTNMLFSQWRDAEEFEDTVNTLFNTIDQKVPGTETPDQLYNVIKTASEDKDVRGKRATEDNGKHLDASFDKLLKQWLDLDQSITIRVRLFIYHKITHGDSQKVINHAVEGIEKLAAYYKEKFIPIFIVQTVFKSHPTLFDPNGFARQADKLIAEANHAASLAESKRTSAVITASDIPAPAPAPHDWDEEKFVPAVTKLFNTIEEQIGISRGQVYIHRRVVQSPEQLYQIIKIASEDKDVRGKRATDDDEGKHLGETTGKGNSLLQQWADLDLYIARMVKSFIDKLIRHGRNPAAINQTVADIGTLVTYYRNNFIPIFMTSNGISLWSSPDGFARQYGTVQRQAAQAAQTAIERFGKSAEKPAPEQKSALEQKNADIPGALTTIREGIDASNPDKIQLGLGTLNSLATGNPGLATEIAKLTDAINFGDDETREMQFAIISSLATGESKTPAGISGNAAGAENKEPLPTQIGPELLAALPRSSAQVNDKVWANLVLTDAVTKYGKFVTDKKTMADPEVIIFTSLITRIIAKLPKDNALRNKLAVIETNLKAGPPTAPRKKLASVVTKPIA